MALGCVVGLDKDGKAHLLSIRGKIAEFKYTEV